MEKVKVKGFCGILRNRKLGFAMFFSIAVACVLGCIVATSSSNGGNRIMLLSASAVKSDALPESNRTANGVVISRDHSDEWQGVKMRVTAYCPCPKCCGKYSDGVTASGHRIKTGDSFVAADKKHPFDTEMIIADYNDDKPVRVLDRGGAISGNKLDVFFDSHQKALEWGLRYVNVKVRYR